MFCNTFDSQIEMQSYMFIQDSIINRRICLDCMTRWWKPFIACHSHASKHNMLCISISNKLRV